MIQTTFFSFLVDHQEYTEYTDAYGRPEIEMMKNNVGNHDLLSQEENKEHQPSGDQNKKQKQPNNWYLLSLTGMYVYETDIRNCSIFFITTLMVIHHNLMQIFLQFLYN